MKDEKRLQEVSEEILREMTAWNASHPKATFLEIEVKARELVSQLEAQLIQESALEREAADWSRVRGKGTAKLPTLSGAPASARQADPPVPRTSRQNYSPPKNLQHLSHLWNRLFPPSMSD